MNSIVYVGMDVHTTHFTMCCHIKEENMDFAQMEIKPDVKSVLKYLENVRKEFEDGDEIVFKCVYEAGCLGYTLQKQLVDCGVDCSILAPTTMPQRRRTEIKTDKRDARKCALCLANNTASLVHIPTEEDEATRDYIRMRNDAQGALRRIKQQTTSFCNRHGQLYKNIPGGGNYWTKKHLAWLGGLDLGNPLLNETLQEYLVQYRQAVDRVELYDKRIVEISNTKPYKGRVGRLRCFLGIDTLTALAMLVETSDFVRFATAQHYASYLGLVPGERSSGDSIHRTGITKTGNGYMRRLLIEAAQCYSRGTPGFKSKALKARQAGNDPDVIAYADRANNRLRRRFFKLIKTLPYNKAVMALARELACFVWGMMTDNIA